MRLKDLKGFFAIEAVYPGNIGAMEVFQFYQAASSEQKTELNHLITREEYEKAWELIQKVTGVRLDPMSKE